MPKEIQKERKTDPSAVSAFRKLKGQFANVNNMCRQTKPSICLHFGFKLLAHN